MQYAGALRVLADKAYTNWTADQRGEVLRNHFIEGVSSPSVQLRLMREMPVTLDAALSLAVQQQSVEMARQRLYKEIHRGDAAAMALQQRGEEEGTQADPAASNAMSRERACGTCDPRFDELSKELRRLSSELAQFRSDRSRGERQRRQDQRGKSGPTCWKCGKRGHVRRNCPHSQTEGRPERSYRSITATNNSALIVDGVVEGRPTKMLIDSGSAVTILCEDVWKAACTKPCGLDTPGLPVGRNSGPLRANTCLPASCWYES